MGQRSGTDFRMVCSVVLLLDPGLGCQTERIKGEIGFAFEHGHQATFNAPPEGFLFRILIGRIR